MAQLPQKLIVDPIAEALCEIRFESPESDQVPEVALGKLSQHPSWKDFKVVRLPISDIPAPVRKQDANLKYQPNLELRSSFQPTVVKLGPNVASYHCLAPYPGWHVFEQELSSFVEHIFTCLEAFVCTRIGFRYVNTFSAARHPCVSGIDSFNLNIEVSGEQLRGPKNLNYLSEVSESASALVRVAAPSFVNGATISDLTALIDVDVFTNGEVSIQDPEQALSWINLAHTSLKREFFGLFTNEMRHELIEV